MNKTISVSIVDGKSKKSGKPYKAVKLDIGDWSTLVFPRSKFEMTYIEKVISENEDL